MSVGSGIMGSAASKATFQQGQCEKWQVVFSSTSRIGILEC